MAPTERGKTDNVVYRNVETHSFNQCCSGKVLRITHSECVYVTLSIPHAMQSLGPEGSRKLKLPDFMTTAQDSG